MKNLILLAFLFCAVPLFADDLRKEIEQRNRDLTAALERGDLLGVARIYADDARIVGHGKSWSGREEIDRYWTSLTSAKSWKLEVLAVGGTRDDAYQVGRSTLVMVRDGKERTSVVEFVVIWRRDASGKLRIWLDMYS